MIRFSETYPLGAIMRSTPTASNGPFGPVPLAIQRTNMTSPFVACSIGSAREVGNEVEQIDDALGILLRPPDRTRGLRPVTGDVWHGNRWHPGQHARLVRVEPRLPPVLDPVRTSLLRQLVIRPSRRHQKRTGTSCHSDKNGSTRDDLVSSGHSSLLCLDTLHNAALSRLVLKPTDASAHVTKMFDRVPPVDYAEGNAL